MSLQSRYCQQEAFPGIGPKGQERLKRSRVLLAGCGALGSAMASLLARAGVGFIRLVDRDILEIHNLHRQILYDERDVESHLPKAILAKRHIERINSSIEVEAVVVHLGPGNVLKLIEDVDLILDGLDNLPTRYLINDASVKTRKPWIYGGAVGSTGNVMVILPKRTPCLRCIFPEPPSPIHPTCDTAGILGPTATAVASIETAEALKLLVGNKDYLLPGMLTIDLWEGYFRTTEIKVALKPDCPCCGKDQFRHLYGQGADHQITLCGGNALHLLPLSEIDLDLKGFFKNHPMVKILGHNDYLVRFMADEHELTIFSDGRAIVNNTTDHELARSLYERFCKPLERGRE